MSLAEPMTSQLCREVSGSLHTRGPRSPRSTADQDPRWNTDDRRWHWCTARNEGTRINEYYIHNQGRFFFLQKKNRTLQKAWARSPVTEPRRKSEIEHCVVLTSFHNVSTVVLRVWRGGGGRRGERGVRWVWWCGDLVLMPCCFSIACVAFQC